MSDRYNMSQVKAAFGVWLQAIGGIMRSEAREKGWPITNTYAIENGTIMAEGRVRLRVVKITSENGNDHPVLGDGQYTAKELCALLRAATDSIEIMRRQPKHDPEMDRVLLPDFLDLTRTSADPNKLTYRDQHGRFWSSVMSRAGHNCAEVTCGRYFQAGYVLNPCEDYGVGLDPDWMKRPIICISHVMNGTGYHHLFSGSSEYKV